jgi:hypothetical protein
MKRIFVAACLLFLVGTLVQGAAAQSWSPNGPLPRSYGSAVLDTSTQRMIIFGGFPTDTSSTQNLNDVWRLNPALNALGGTGLNWFQIRATGTPPAPRFGHSAGYDPGSNRMIIFGGAEGRSSPCANDVWVLTNANGTSGTPAWIQLSPAGGPPPARHGAGGVYDPTSNTLIIYAGNNCFSTNFSDVWVLSNANGVGGTPTWTELSPSGGPGQRQNVGTVYDPASNELIIFGGYPGNGGNPFNDVWALSNANGSGGTPVWTQLSPTGPLPAPRGCPTATYDPTTNRMTIFGGAGDSSVLLGDTWVLTDANGLGGTPAWMQIAQSSTDFPAPRTCATAVYAPTTNIMTIFGGQITVTSPTLATNDVFLLNDANGQ